MTHNKYTTPVAYIMWHSTWNTFVIYDQTLACFSCSLYAWNFKSSRIGLNVEYADKPMEINCMANLKIHIVCAVVRDVMPVFG